MHTGIFNKGYKRKFWHLTFHAVCFYIYVIVQPLAKPVFLQGQIGLYKFTFLCNGYSIISHSTYCLCMMASFSTISAVSFSFFSRLCIRMLSSALNRKCGFIWLCSARSSAFSDLQASPALLAYSYIQSGSSHLCGLPSCCNFLSCCRSHLCSPCQS